MIAMPAFAGDPARQKAVLERLALVPLETGEPTGLMGWLAGATADFATAHAATGFPASLLSAADAVVRALPDGHGLEFARALCAAPVPGRNLSDAGWQLVEELLAQALATEGDSFVRTAFSKAELFGRLPAWLLKPAGKRKAIRRAERVARRLSTSPACPADMACEALLHGCQSGGALNAGAVVAWMVNRSPDPAASAWRCADALLRGLREA